MEEPAEGISVRRGAERLYEALHREVFRMIQERSYFCVKGDLDNREPGAPFGILSGSGGPLCRQERNSARCWAWSRKGP